VLAPDPDIPSAGRLKRNGHVPLDGHWEHEAVIVIGMFADQVYPSRRNGEALLSGSSKSLLENPRCKFRQLVLQWLCYTR